MDFFRAEREDHRSQRLKDFATNPPLLMDLFNHWGSHVPSDTVSRSYLKIDLGLNEQSPRAILGIYKENIVFATVKGDGKIEEFVMDKGSVKNDALPVKIGDCVQWTSNGVDQFKRSRPVVWISDDGAFARVHGEQMGMPVNELSVMEPPKPPAVGPVTANSACSDVSVLMRGKRLEITADVDEAGLANLQEMLSKYAEILKLVK